MKYKSDIEKMQVALEEAKNALEIDEVPIGAALFDDDDKLITRHTIGVKLIKIQQHMLRYW